jgi:hypothetical protein
MNIANPESLLSVVLNLLLIKIHLSRYIMLLFIHISIIVVKCGMCLVKQSKRLQKLQNRAARIIMSMSNYIDHTIALQALGWEPLKSIREKQKQN